MSLDVKRIRLRGYRLLHEGVQALSEIEATGIRIDMDRLSASIAKADADIKRIKGKLLEMDEWRVWRRRFGESANLTSREQLAVVFFEVLGYKCPERTEGGGYSTEVEVLEKIDSKFVRGFLKLSKLHKARGTYLEGIRREVVDGRLHPVFSLHTAVTFRSSSEQPNFQNMPVRDPEQAELIRENFIPSEGNVLVENDFKGVEVSVAYDYHQDPTMRTYLEDPTKDMHRDMAAQLYWLPEDKVPKQARYGAKNKFVFPQFYGDYYKTCAKSLWEWAERAKIEHPDGGLLIDHLKRKCPHGLGPCHHDEDTRPGTFEKHVQEVEDDFWNRRFKVYTKWKKKWYKAYLETGGFDTLTGFRIEGVMSRNDVINYPVQGSAFHCLLWSLIQVNKELRRRKMKARVVGQIHDSMLGDVPPEELSDYLSIVKRITEVDIRKEFKWLLLPLSIECEISPVNRSWFHKQEVHFDNGVYTFTPKGGKDKLKFTSTDEFLKALAASVKPKTS
jgi:DNA polymerase-1